MLRLTPDFFASETGNVRGDFYQNMGKVRNGTTNRQFFLNNIYHKVNAMTTVTWVLDGNSRYEVSSKEHLLQIMNEGSLYTDAGDVPPTYWTSLYVQTADIDLVNDHASILPIGTGSNRYSSVYDGGGFRISNWSYDRGTSDDGSGEYVGLFGYNDGTIQNLRLDGVWNLAGNYQYGGFVAGQSLKATNIHANFDVGTTLYGGKSDANIGSMFGQCAGAAWIHTDGILLRGSVEFDTSISGANVGGLVGYFPYGYASMLRNFADFPNGIVSSSANVGGIVGKRLGCQKLYNVINAMTGDISGNNCGGICGTYWWWQEHQPSTLVNAMTGNIHGSRSAGGIFGDTKANNVQVSATLLVNYMTGNITCGAARNGGIIGLVWIASTTADFAVSNSIVAMNGSVHDTCMASATSVPSLTEVTVDTSFGMTFTNNGYATTNALTGYLTHADFTDLPYLDLNDVDTKGNTQQAEFVIASLPGNSSYSTYDYLAISRGKVHSIYADLGLSESNTQDYLTYGNTENNTLYTDGSFTVADSDASVIFDYTGTVILFGVSPSTLGITPGPVSMSVLVEAIANTVDLKLTHQDSTGTERLSAAGFLSGQRTIRYLNPETEYTLRLYTKDTETSPFVLANTQVVSTTANSAENYTLTDFVEDGKFKIGSSDGAFMSAVMNDIFTTGDDLEITLGQKDTNARFVNRGGTTSIEDADAFLLPFDTGSGSSQTISLQLSDNTTASVDYNEVDNTISVGSIVYSPGDYLLIDGKKCTVYEY